jgi:hypothetical protein
MSKASKRSILINTIARLLGCKSSLHSEINEFLAKKLERSSALITSVRWKHNFGFDTSLKLKELLGDKAPHLALDTICNFGTATSSSSDNATEVSSAKPQKKRRRKNCKAPKRVKRTAEAKVTSTVPSTAPKTVVAPAAAPAPTPKAGVVPSASVLEISGSDGRKIMITEVMHEGSLHSAILLPVGCDLSVISGEASFTITVK